MLENHVDAGNGSCIDVSVSLDARDECEASLMLLEPSMHAMALGMAMGQRRRMRMQGVREGSKCIVAEGFYILTDSPIELDAAACASALGRSLAAFVVGAGGPGGGRDGVGGVELMVTISTEG